MSESMTVEQERDELRRRVESLETELVGQNHKFDVLMSLSAPTEQDAEKLLARIKAAAVREAHDWPVFFSQNSAGYDDLSYSAGFDDAMAISFARIKEIAAQMEVGQKIAGTMENNDSGIEFKANQIEGGA